MHPVLIPAAVIAAAPLVSLVPTEAPHATNVGFAATAGIKRSDFGLGYGMPIVSDKVDLVINAASEVQ